MLTHITLYPGGISCETYNLRKTTTPQIAFGLKLKTLPAINVGTIFTASHSLQYHFFTKLFAKKNYHRIPLTIISIQYFTSTSAASNAGISHLHLLLKESLYTRNLSRQIPCCWPYISPSDASFYSTSKKYNAKSLQQYPSELYHIQFKTGYIIPIFKSNKNKTSLDSYHPISLNSCLAKT